MTKAEKQKRREEWERKMKMFFPKVDKADEVAEKYSAPVNIGVGAITDICEGQWRDLERRLKDDGTYRQETKKIGTEINRVFEALQSSIRSHSEGMTELSYTVLDIITDESRQDVTRMYYAIKNHLDKKRIIMSDVRAQAVTLYWLAMLASQTFDAICLAVKMIACIDGQATYADMNPSKLRWVTHRMQDRLCGFTADVYDALLYDPQCKLGREILERRLTDPDLLGSYSRKALLSHPETAALASRVEDTTQTSQN